MHNLLNCKYLFIKYIFDLIWFLDDEFASCLTTCEIINAVECDVWSCRLSLNFHIQLAFLKDYNYSRARCARPSSRLDLTRWVILLEQASQPRAFNFNPVFSQTHFQSDAKYGLVWRDQPVSLVVCVSIVSDLVQQTEIYRISMWYISGSP